MPVASLLEELKKLVLWEDLVLKLIHGTVNFTWAFSTTQHAPVFSGYLILPFYTIAVSNPLYSFQTSNKPFSANDLSVI